MENYDAILELINSKLKENERMLNHYREENAKLVKENAELKEANAKLVKENDELKLALMN